MLDTVEKVEEKVKESEASSGGSKSKKTPAELAFIKTQEKRVNMSSLDPQGYPQALLLILLMECLVCENTSHGCVQNILPKEQAPRPM